MHADQIANVARRHDGVVPPTWLTGDTDYQKAAVIAAVAWHDIKDPADPELPKCDITFRENCIGVVESLMRGNTADETPFAQAAARRWTEAKEAMDHPTAKEIDHD